MEVLSSDTDDCFAVRQAARHISKLYERHLSRAGITPTQFSILNALCNTPHTTMIRLADALVMDRTTLVRVLKPLLRDGFVSTLPDHDRSDRRMRVALTETGLEKLHQAMVHWRAAQTAFEQTFGPAQAAHLRSELFRITRDVLNT